jgi:adenylosuccinate synthase
LEFVAEETGVPIAVVSVGPDRAETIIVRPDALWG